MGNNEEIIKTLNQYLGDVNDILKKFKSIVGKPDHGKSWVSNIPSTGSFPELGIKEFSRHGVGIWVKYMDKFVDFNFVDFHFHSVFDPEYKLDVYFENHFIEIDMYFFFSYLESLNKDCKIDEEIWITKMNELVSEGILSKIEPTSITYYFTKDIEMVVKIQQATILN